LKDIPLAHQVDNVEQWKHVLDSFYNILRQTGFYKALYGIALCLASKQGPWRNFPAAIEVLEVLIRKKEHNSKPPTREFKIYIALDEM